MKNIFRYLLPAFAAILVFQSCEKDEDKIVFEGGTAPVLTASASGPMVLNRNDANNLALRLNWTNPGYKFSTGISSQNVTYTLQIDTTGANFTNPSRQEISISNDLSKEFTVKDWNSIFSKMNLLENIPHNIEYRIKAVLGDGSVPLFSNLMKMVVTPYLYVAVEIPASGKLYITGSATPASWMGDNAPELLSQKFTQVNNTLYEIVINLSANNSFLFVPVYGNWSTKYGFDGDGNKNNVNGDNFKLAGNDIKAPSTSGSYKVTVNFKTGKYTVAKQ